MCPDPQLISIYLDGELPSPWKEKLEKHLTECSTCREKLEAFGQLVKKPVVTEQEMIEAAKDRVWRNLQSRRRFQPRAVNSLRPVRNTSSFLQRRLSIPIPAAAAAAVVIVLLTMVLFNGGQGNNEGFASIHQPSEAPYLNITQNGEVPAIIPTNVDMSMILDQLVSEGDIIILRLPESQSFHRAGEPEMIRAADYQRTRPPRRHP